MTKFSGIESLNDAWRSRKVTLTDARRQIVEARERSLNVAVGSGIPTTRSEEWKYTSLRSLLDQQFDLLSPIKHHKTQLDSAVVDKINTRLVADAIPLVFVNGRLDLTWPGSEFFDVDMFRTLSDVELEEDVSWWQSWQSMRGVDQLFAAVNVALAHEGVVIKLHKGQKLLRPIHILHVSNGDMEKNASINRVLIKLAQDAKIRVYEEFLVVNEEGDLSRQCVWNNSLTQMLVGPGADCGYYRILSAPGSYHTGAVSMRLDHGSRLETISLTTGSKFARINMDVEFLSANAECIINGLYLVREEEHIDHHTAVDHQVGHCRTHQLFKGIVSDHGRAVFNGKIFIRKDAQKTEAFQTTKNLLLSPNAQVDAKPQLEIDADDVKASHGAAIGSIDPTELFYLQSRGIGRLEAVAILCKGFADDVVSRLSDVNAQALLKRRIHDWFQDSTLNSGF